MSFFTVVASKTPATVIFTHPVNSSENLTLPKNKNHAMINKIAQIPTRRYALFIIENGAFI